MDGDLNLSMFRAYDIRTPSAKLTPDLAARLARAEAVYFRHTLGVGGVVLAHDARQTGPAYLSIAAEEFVAAGLEVVVIPCACSTPMLYFAAMQHPEWAAIMIGASHNPPGDTGQKILGPDVFPVARGIGPEGGLDRIQELYEADARPPRSARGRIMAHDPADAYVQYSLGLAGVRPGGLRGIRVVHDYLYGAAGRDLMLGFARAGADLVPLHFTADGAFPLGAPNPVIPHVTAPGQETLREAGALLGTFFDGDGDRIDFYRGDGAYLSSSFVYAGILPLIRERFAGPGWVVFADLKCNPLALIRMAATGVSVRVIRNGHSQIKFSMIQEPSAIGTVEESAHFYEAFTLGGRTRYCTENSLYTALLVTRAWAEDPARFDELLDVQATTCRAGEWGYRFPSDTARAEALRAVEEHFAAQGARAMHEMDNGMDLEATLMRRGLPFSIDASTTPGDDWLQVCQRISQSEDGLARWEIVGASPSIVNTARQEIAECVRRFGAGEEYRG